MRNFPTSLVTACLLALAFAVGGPAMAEPTKIEVSALAHGAKFIGDRSGGARITIADAETGAVLAEGVTSGGTGDTQVIMKAKQPRWTPIVTPGAASFSTTLDIDAPRRLAITAVGPLDAALDDQVRASSVTWLLPGQSLDGERRVVVELTGYFVTVEEISLEDGVSAVIDVGMLCGCPVMPGGLWNADRIRMQAVLVGSSGRETAQLEHVEGTRYQARFPGKVGEPQVIEFHIDGMDDANVGVFRQVLD